MPNPPETTVTWLEDWVPKRRSNLSKLVSLATRIIDPSTKEDFSTDKHIFCPNFDDGSL